MPRVYLPCTDSLIAILKADVRMQTAVGTRIFAGTPFGDPLTSPWITLARVGGGPSSEGTLPEDRPLYLFNCWAGIKEQLVAEGVAMAAATVVDSLEEKCPLLQGGVIFEGGYVLPGSGPRYFHDPDDDRARYVFQARFTCIAANQT